MKSEQLKKGYTYYDTINKKEVKFLESLYMGQTEYVKVCDPEDITEDSSGEIQSSYYTLPEKLEKMIKQKNKTAIL